MTIAIDRIGHNGQHWSGYTRTLPRALYPSAGRRVKESKMKTIIRLGFIIWAMRHGGMRRIVKSRVSMFRETQCRVCLFIRDRLIRLLE